MDSNAARKDFGLKSREHVELLLETFGRSLVLGKTDQFQTQATKLKINADKVSAKGFARLGARDAIP